MQEFVEDLNWATKNYQRSSSGPLWVKDDDHGLGPLEVALNNYWVRLGLNFAALWSVRIDALNWTLTLRDIYDTTDENDKTVDQE